MPAKKVAKKTTKTESKPKTGRKIKKDQAYECGICGFRIIVDECGCVEEHYLICCDKPMTQKRGKKTTKKPPAQAAKEPAKKPAKKTTKKATKKTTKKK